MPGQRFEASQFQNIRVLDHPPVEMLVRRLAVLVLALLVRLDLVCLSQAALLALLWHLALMTRFALEGLAQAEQSLVAKDPARSQGSVHWLALC
jgi:hypothetical protein